MAKRIKLVFPTSGVEVVATLLEEQAPATCETVWKVLEKPLEGKVYHGHETGPEIYFFMPPAPDLPNENSTVFPIPGDLLFYHYDGQLPRGEKVYDVGVYYGRGGKGLLAVGWTPGNLFAAVTENLEGLQKVGREVSNSGPQPVVVERAGDQS